MPDYQRQGPLDHLGLEGKANTDQVKRTNLKLLPIYKIFEIRCKWNKSFANSVKEIAGFAPPTTSPNTTHSDDLTIFWMGPDRWWLVGYGDHLCTVNELQIKLSVLAGTIVELGESFAAIEVSGPSAKTVLTKGCSIDLDPNLFQVGHVIQTNLAKAQITLHQSNENEYRVFVRRSFTEYLWTWLEDASLEYATNIQYSTIAS